MAKKKKGNTKADLEYQKAKEQGLKEFNADMEKLFKSDFADFKKGTIKQLRDIEETQDTLSEAIFMVVENEGEQRSMMLEAITKAYKKGFKNFDKAMGVLHERLCMVEMFLLVLAIKSMGHFENRPMDHESKKELASMLSVDWDGTIEELQRSLLKKAKLKEAA